MMQRERQKPEKIVVLVSPRLHVLFSCSVQSVCVCVGGLQHSMLMLSVPLSPHGAHSRKQSKQTNTLIRPTSSKQTERLCGVIAVINDKESVRLRGRPSALTLKMRHWASHGLLTSSQRSRWRVQIAVRSALYIQKVYTTHTLQGLDCSLVIRRNKTLGVTKLTHK